MFVGWGGSQASRKTVLFAALGVAVLLAVVAVHAFHTGSGGADAGAPSSCPEPVTLKAYLCIAAREAWDRIIEGFEQRHPCIRVDPVYGASGRLLAQMLLAGDGSLYAPASPGYMREAVRRGLVDPSTVTVVAYLEPAILVPAGNPAGIHSLEDLARPGVRVALGDPESVAVGRYAYMLLRNRSLLGKVEPNVVVYAENFAQLVALVASGAVDAAIGWSVAAHWQPGRVEAIPVPGAPRVPVTIAAARGLSGGERRAAMLFIGYARGAAEAWRAAGYLPATPGG